MNIVCFVFVRKDGLILVERRINPEYQRGKLVLPWAMAGGTNPDRKPTEILREQLWIEGDGAELKEVLHWYQGFTWKAESGIAKDYCFNPKSHQKAEPHPSQDISELRLIKPLEIFQDPDLDHFHRDVTSSLGIRPLGIWPR